MPDTLQLVLMGIALMIGSAIQSAIGFAFGLFCVPVLLLIGMEPFEAIAIVAPCAMIQTGLSVYRHRSEAPYRLVLPLAMFGILFQPLGVWLLSLLVTLGPDTIKQVFGGVLLAALAAQGWLRPRAHKKLHTGWGLAAFGGAGLLNGLSGMGGPPLVLWVMAHDWNSRQCRITLWLIFLSMLPTNLILQSVQFGPGVWTCAGIGTLFFPFVLLGSVPGHWLGTRLPKAMLKRIAVVVLIVIGLYAVLQPVIAEAMQGATAP